jgi:nucleoside-diphosphate-sugar epimerase
MNLFVTGATGYIGSVVTQRLVSAGHAVTALARSERTRACLAEQGVAPAPGDLTDVRRVAELASAADAVVWVATSNREDIDAPAVAAILERLRGSGKTFLYTSGVWVHGDTRGLADEDSPLEAAELVAWRVPVEQRVLATAGVRGLVVRPGIAYGRNGGIPTMPTASVNGRGAARFVGSGDNRWATVFVDDLAELYRRALEVAPAGSVLIGVQEPAFRVREIAQAASLGRGAGGRVESWPLAEARAELGVFADALVLDQEFSAARAERLLGWKPAGPSIVEELSRGSYAVAGAGPTAAAK